MFEELVSLHPACYTANLSFLSLGDPVEDLRVRRLRMIDELWAF